MCKHLFSEHEAILGTTEFTLEDVRLLSSAGMIWKCFVLKRALLCVLTGG
jgi:hypothetical protein